MAAHSSGNQRNLNDNEVREMCLAEIARSGVEKLGYQAVDIHKGTYYRYKKAHPDFQEEVTAALKTYQNSKLSAVQSRRELVEAYLARCLSGDQWKTKITTSEKDGTKTEREQVQPPGWWLQRVIEDPGATNTEVTIVIKTAMPEPTEEERQEDQEDYAGEFDE